jgi:hypothetical protein
MSEPQEIIARNFEQICRDVGISLDDKYGQLEKTKLYTAIRSFVYEWMYDYSTSKDIGLSDHILEAMKKNYKPNKYEQTNQE